MVPDACNIGRFRLDLRGARLSLDGRHIAVGGRAMDVLLALAEARGEVVGHAALIDRAWPGRTIEENNLPVQIAALRKLLGTAPDGSSWIRTVSGRGYRLDIGPGREPPEAAVRPADALSFCRTADGLRLAVGVTGEGVPLVRVGLWMTHLEHEWQTRVWAPLLGRLSAATRLVRYDQRGFGLSDRQVAAFSLDRSVSDLAAVLDHAGLERASILGMSQGVPVAIRFAAQHPERVERLILHGGFAKGWGVDSPPEAVERNQALITLIRQGWGSDNPSFRQVFTSLGFPDGTREDFDAYNELQRRSASGANAAAMVESLRDIDVRPDLERVRAKTLVIHSMRDAWVRVEAGQSVAAGIAGARFLPLDSSNHLPIPPDPQFERLAEVIIEAVTAP